jgi:hypothetical protein
LAGAQAERAGLRGWGGDGPDFGEAVLAAYHEERLACFDPPKEG